MKMNFVRLAFLFLLGCCQSLSAHPQGVATDSVSPVKVACVGNSITYGFRIPDRSRNSYPAQLQTCLGAGYEVRNFGVSGRTLLSHGDLPYVQTEAYAQSRSFNPDIVLIKLGTNDTKPQNWKYEHEFQTDYQQLIEAYRALPARPRIILLTPTRAFLKPTHEISNSLILDEVTPRVNRLAYDNQLEILHMTSLFGNQWDSSLLPDRLHPSAAGACLMAEKIGAYLKRTSHDLAALTPSTESPAQQLGGHTARAFNFHGFTGYEFSLDGVACKIVEPRVPAKGNPWIWRARFWGHEPQTDIAMLEAGFHVAYCDVADLYGAPSAVKRWDRFYRKMTQTGFHAQPVLEGMSRGALIVYNWAARNPRKVSCIYADAPVMDFASWPLGKGESAGSVSDAQQLCKAYGFRSTEAAARAAQKRLKQCVKQMGKARIPILHVVGDADSVVPVAENTRPFAEAMDSLNAPIQVIHKPDCNHHPHSLYNPQPIVDFILRATGRLESPGL